MRNLLLSEYEAEITKVAAKFGADPDRMYDQSPHWTAPLGAIGASISLAHFRQGSDRCMIPEARTGSSRGLPSDLGHALVVLKDSEATIIRVLSALISLGDIRVWISDAPCDHCSATGGTRNGPCKRCGGTGKRNERAPE